MNLGGPYKMSDELRAALERARDHVATPEEKFEQRVSFIYGQQDHDNPNPRSKDEIRAWLIEHYGHPPCPKCAAQVDRSPEGGDRETGRHAEHESAVGSEASDAPETRVTGSNGVRDEP